MTVVASDATAGMKPVAGRCRLLAAARRRQSACMRASGEPAYLLTRNAVLKVQ